MILTVFRSRLRPEAQAEYGELAPQMSKLARSMPGYKSHKVFVAEDGERLTLVEFEDDARACHQFSQMTAATQWIAPRKAQARLS